VLKLDVPVPVGVFETLESRIPISVEASDASEWIDCDCRRRELPLASVWEEDDDCGDLLRVVLEEELVCDCADEKRRGSDELATDPSSERRDLRLELREVSFRELWDDLERDTVDLWPTDADDLGLSKPFEACDTTKLLEEPWEEILPDPEAALLRLA
jgi:hypothetical protein